MSCAARLAILTALIGILYLGANVARAAGFSSTVSTAALWVLASDAVVGWLLVEVARRHRD